MLIGTVLLAGVCWAQTPLTDAGATRPVDPRRLTPIVQVVRAARDSVVNISCTTVVKVRTPMPGFDLLEEFFDMPGPRTERQLRRTSAGSGFVIHRDGYIVTNAHVVERTADTQVTFADGRAFAAQVVAVDAERDLAVLKVQADHPLQPLPLGTSADLMPGEPVVAIGNPLGYENTVTAGVVSATNREIQAGDGVTFRGLIQTDASINPGNSGGPLLNMAGELIGINTAIRADAQNIGFAIPVDQLRQLLPELLDVERRYRIRFGARVAGEGPVLVTRIESDSPAQAADVRVGDQVVAINGQKVRTALDVEVALIGRRAGDGVDLELWRDGASVKTTVVLAERPRPDGAKLLEQKFGLKARLLRPDSATGGGLAVTKVEPGSPAADIGLDSGDVIVQIGRYRPTDAGDLGELLEAVKPGQKVALVVLRIGEGVIYRATTTITSR